MPRSLRLLALSALIFAAGYLLGHGTLSGTAFAQAAPVNHADPIPEGVFRVALDLVDRSDEQAKVFGTRPNLQQTTEYASKVAHMAAGMASYYRMQGGNGN